ncbi:MAG: CBS domain-containing protein [Gammaproteobacteria bacterium]|nr:CBS domain-containing protein [Gammaproteobacteria bacterium]MDE2347428.1 CBS domain-containing protein [Gammaproteobacteria bacterium]
MLLKAICTPDVICCGPETSVQAAAALMRAKHTGDLVVVDDPEQDRIPLGVITDRDIVVEVLAAGLDPAATVVRTLLRTPIVVAQEDEDAAEALERMRTHGIRRLPVVGRGGGLVGVVTLDDMLKLMADGMNALVAIVGRQRDREQRQRR